MISKSPHNICEVRYASTLYVPSKQIILLIGGEYWKDKMMGIWKFCLVTKKWKKLEALQFNYCNVSSHLTSDEGYVIIGGGSDKDNCYMNKMYVLDIRDEDEYKLMECDIKLPMENAKLYKIVGSGGGIKDEILVVGWIKQEFKKRNFKDLLIPPMYIMQLIALWYNQEMIHWISRQEDNNHCCIKLKHVLSSLL